MKKNVVKVLVCAGMFFGAGTLAAQTPQSEWQQSVENLKNTIKSNPEQAEDDAKALVKGKNKKNADLIIAISRAYLDAGKIEEAENYQSMANKADKKNGNVWVLKGDIELAKKDGGKAGANYLQAIGFDPQCKDAYLKYASLYRASSPTEAINKLQEMKAAIPSDSLEANQMIANIHYSNNRFKQAAAAYETFINTPLATERDQIRCAFSMFMTHDFEKSLAIVNKGLQGNARHAGFNRLAMYNYTDLKRYPEAEKAADAFFNNSDSANFVLLDYRYYGILMNEQKNYDKAAEAYTKAIEKDSTDLGLWKELATAYEKGKKYQQAADIYKKYYDKLENGDEKLNALMDLGILYYSWGTSTDSVAVPVEQRQPALVQADTIFAEVSVNSPESFTAKLYRARVKVAMDPETTEGLARPYYEALMTALEEKKDPKYNPYLIECYRYLGYYYYLKEDMKQMEYWNKILVIDPDNAMAKAVLESVKQ